jgi:hypothetical protein
MLKFMAQLAVLGVLSDKFAQQSGQQLRLVWDEVRLLGLLL